MDKLIKDDLIDEKKVYRDNIKRYLRDMDELLNFWTTKSSRLTLIDCIFRTFAKLHGLQISRTNKTTYTEWRFMNSKHSVFVTEVFHDDLFRNTSEWIKNIIRSMADIENYLDLPHWEEEFPEEEHKRYADDGTPYYYWEFNYRPFKECVAVTQPAPESKPEPKKVYLTTHNPYLSKDWKKRFEEIMEARTKIDPWSITVDTDVVSMYPKLEPLVKEELAIHSPSKALYEAGKLAAKSFNEGILNAHKITLAGMDHGFSAVQEAVRAYAEKEAERAMDEAWRKAAEGIDKAWDEIIERYCMEDVKETTRLYNAFKEKEESMYDWMAHSVNDIFKDMGTILHRRQITEKDFKSKEWVWEISEDIWQRLKEKPEFIGHYCSANLPATIYCIDVRVTNLKTNYIKLVKKEKENAMDKLYTTKNGILELDGVRYPIRINEVCQAFNESTHVNLYVTGEGNSNYMIMPRHSGYSAHSFFIDELHWAAQRSANIPGIKKVMFEDPATIVFWKDGTKTVVRAQDEAFDPEKGLAMAISRKALGNQRDYYNVFLKWLKKFKKNKK